MQQACANDVKSKEEKSFAQRFQSTHHKAIIQIINLLHVLLEWAPVNSKAYVNGVNYHCFGHNDLQSMTKAYMI